MAGKRTTKARKGTGGGAFNVEDSWPEMREENRLLSQIYPYPSNPRTHPPAQVALLAELIKKHGPDQRIVVDEDGVILKGHGRHQAAILAGLKEFPIVVRLSMSEDDKRAMRISDNQVAILSGWDKELIRAEMGALKLAGYDMPLLGFGETQLVQFMSTPGPPGAFQQYGDDIPTDFCCPKCRHQWSGNPMAGKVKEKKVRRKNGAKAE